MLVVADASALVPALVDTSMSGDAVRAWLVELSDGQQLHVVRNLTQLECLSALRKLVARGDLGDGGAELASKRFIDLPARRWDLTQPMITRIWELRHNLTAYDAAYVALVERLQSEERDDVTLATADIRLANAPGLSINVSLCDD